MNSSEVLHLGQVRSIAMTTQYEVILVSLLQIHPFRIIAARVLHCPDIVEGCSMSGRADLIIAPFTLFSLSFLFFIKHNPPLYSTKVTCSKDNFCFKRIDLFEISSSPSSIDHEPRKKITKLFSSPPASPVNPLIPYFCQLQSTCINLTICSSCFRTQKVFWRHY